MKRQFQRFLEKIGHYNQLVSDYTRAVATSPDHAMAHVNWGIDLAMAGRMEDALLKFEQAASLAPQRWEVFTNWGVALARLDRLNDAVEKFQQAIDLSPKTPSNYVLWGAVLMEQGLVEQATVKYQKAIEIAPENPEPYVNWGVALAKNGDYFSALRNFKTAITLNAFQPHVYFLWGAVLAELQDYETAIDKFKMTLRLLPGHADSYYFWSVSLNRMGRYELALEKSKKALQYYLQREQEKPEAYLNQGDILANLKRYDLAIANYQHAATLAPQAAEAFLSWGVALCKQDVFEEGFKKLYQAQALNPSLSGLPQALGQYLLQINQPDEALPYLEAAHVETPTQVDVMLNYAMALIKTGGTERALELLRAVEKVDQWNSQVHYLLGTHYMGAGDFPMARKHLEKAITEQPEFEDAAINLSLVLCELGEAPDAIRSMRPLLRKYPESARINFFYGTVQYHAGDYKEAAQKFLKAQRLDPLDLKPNLGLGELYLKQGDLSQAEAVLKEALINHSTSAPALFLLGCTLLRLNKLQEANLNFEQVIALSPQHLEARCFWCGLQGQLISLVAMQQAYERLLADFPSELQQATILMAWANVLDAMYRGDVFPPDWAGLSVDEVNGLRSQVRDVGLGLQQQARQLYPEIDLYLAKSWS